MSESEKSKILIVGATGDFGKFLVEASAKSGHPTFALIRESTARSPDKSKLVETFKKSYGVTIISGDMYDHEVLVAAVKQVDVVISAVGSEQQLIDQVKIIAAIKEAGNIKRFFPSEFGLDTDHVHPIEPIASLFEAKARIRRTIEAEGIPHTYVSSTGFAGYFLPNLVQVNATSPPRDKVTILGNGNTKGIFLKEEDIATYTIKAVDDPRTLNRALYMRPTANILSFNDLVSMWEKKIGKSLERTYISEDQLLRNIQEATMPSKIFLSIAYCVFVNGDMTNFEIESSSGADAFELYPDVKYTTIDEYLDQFV